MNAPVLKMLHQVLQMTTIPLQVCVTQRELIHVMMMDISVKMDGMDIYVYMVSTILKIIAVSMIVLFLRVVESGISVAVVSSGKLPCLFTYPAKC